MGNGKREQGNCLWGPYTKGGIARCLEHVLWSVGGKASGLLRGGETAGEGKIGRGAGSHRPL